MGTILTLVSAFFPYILGAIGVISAYFFVKNKGVKQEREKQDLAKAEAVARVTVRLAEAVGQDAAIDTKTTQQIEEVKKHTTPTQPDRPDRFRF